MQVLLVSTYELGHQPLHLASPAAALIEAGHEVSCLDLAVSPWDEALFNHADAVAFSVPMHTAMRLAVQAASRLRGERPEVPICFYGLYAGVSKDRTLARLADRLIAGEYEPGLITWLEELEHGSPQPRFEQTLTRTSYTKPARHLLPPIDAYAHVWIEGEQRPAGYVEATHGCAFECRHCPVPAVYGGRLRKIPRPVVLADIEQLVEAGARHITFGDPDFLGGWKHSLLLVREMHEAWPELTFDCTTKVEMVLKHSSLWEEFARCGCAFVVSAFETLNDRILAILEKGHSAREEREVVRLLRSVGIEPRPSFLPFTPWTSLQDVSDLLDFVASEDLIGGVDPVQYSIRLLLPEGSLLLAKPELAPYLGDYDPELLTYTWRAQDPRVDELQERIAEIVQDAAEQNLPPGAAFLDIYRAVLAAGGTPRTEPQQVAARPTPHLTEPWFC